MKWSDGVITSGSSTTTNRMYYAGLPANGFGAGWQLIDERDGTGALVRKYVYGPGIDEPARMTTSNGTKYYFEQDGLGNVTELASSIGAVIERYTYDVYGTPTIYDSSFIPQPSSLISNRLLFTGRDIDPDTGLYNFRYRYYSPSLGRFVQPDPINIMGGDLNLYRYVGNNPVGVIDATGLFSDLFSWKTIGGGVLGLVGGVLLITTMVTGTVLVSPWIAGGLVLAGAGLEIWGMMDIGDKKKTEEMWKKTIISPSDPDIPKPGDILKDGLSDKKDKDSTPCD